jgi:hypothetical protein
MPKIDVTKIENYEAMTPEEKLAAIEAYEFEPDVPEIGKLKAALTKANSEAAELKRKHNALLTEEQRKEAERAEKEAAIQSELELLRKEKAVSNYKAKYLGLGYDEKLADETAQALADGDIDKVFANHKVHIENIKKAERATALAGDPKPPAGSKGTVDFSKEIEAAKERGDMVMVASLTRQQYQMQHKKE